MDLLHKVWTMVQADLSMMIFSTMAVVGGIYCFFAFALGHGDHDHDFGDGHDFGGHGDHDGGDAPSVFSLRNLMLFLTGYGAIGALARYHGASFLMSSFWGMCSGALMAMLAYLVYRALYKSQATSNIDNRILVGSTATVEQMIPAEGLGVVMTGEAIGHIIRLRARNKLGRSVPAGKSVRILEIAGTEALIEPLQ